MALDVAEVALLVGGDERVLDHERAREALGEPLRLGARQLRWLQGHVAHPRYPEVLLPARVPPALRQLVLGEDVVRRLAPGDRGGAGRGARLRAGGGGGLSAARGEQRQRE